VIARVEAFAQGALRKGLLRTGQAENLMAGRVTEMVTRIKIALPTAYPYQVGFAMLAGRIAKLPP